MGLATYSRFLEIPTVDKVAEYADPLTFESADYSAWKCARRSHTFCVSACSAPSERLHHLLPKDNPPAAHILPPRAHIMFGFLAKRFQSPRPGENTRPGWFDRHCTPILLSIAKKACTHPVHTIVTIAILASYSYLGVLDKGFLEQDIATPGYVDFNTLLAGSKRLRVGEETAWKWEVSEFEPATVHQVR